MAAIRSDDWLSVRKTMKAPTPSRRDSRAPISLRLGGASDSRPDRDGFLAQVPLFAALGEEERWEVAATGRLRVFKPGEVLFHEGDVGNALFLLQSGEVKVVRHTPGGRETILHVFGLGECLGEMALIDGEPRSATAVALGRVEAVTIGREAFDALMERQPAVARQVMRGLAGMVRRVTQQFQDAICLDVPGRIARTLLALAERYGQECPHGIEICLRLTQEDLAQMVGASRPTVAAQLHHFQRRGILRLRRNGITVSQPEQLQRRIEAGLS